MRCNSFFHTSRKDSKKTRVCTGTHGRSETSLNIVVHENVPIKKKKTNMAFVFQITWKIFFYNWGRFLDQG